MECDQVGAPNVTLCAMNILILSETNSTGCSSHLWIPELGWDNNNNRLNFAGLHNLCSNYGLACKTNACTSVDRSTVLAFVWPAPPTLGERAKVEFKNVACSEREQRDVLGCRTRRLSSTQEAKAESAGRDGPPTTERMPCVSSFRAHVMMWALRDTKAGRGL